jgi:hypothetical protein
MTTPVLLPAVEFDAPLVNPSPGGLYPVTTWVDVEGASRFLGEGVRIRPHNYGLEDAFGVWGAPWCVDPNDLEPEDIKQGVRPDPDADPFEAMTVWAYDQACDPLPASRAEVRERVAQVMRMVEPVAVARQFAVQLLADAGTPDTAADIVGALGHLEGLLAETNSLGFIHMSPVWAVSLRQAQVVTVNGATWKSPMGHTIVLDGGYRQGLGDVLVATSPTYGWRDEVVVREFLTGARDDTLAAIAERSVVVGYEALVGAVDVTG